MTDQESAYIAASAKYQALLRRFGEGEPEITADVLHAAAREVNLTAAAMQPRPKHSERQQAWIDRQVDAHRVLLTMARDKDVAAKTEAYRLQLEMEPSPAVPYWFRLKKANNVTA